jgi:hypothetical protein
MSEVPPTVYAAPPEEQARKETDVEIHKPKPVHSWREFLKEYAIIVLGVLTALAAEQVVESLRHSADVREMTQKLREESQANLDVIDYDISSTKGAVVALNQAVDALSGGTAPQLTALPQSPSILTPGWKIERTGAYLSDRQVVFHTAYRQAEAAMRVFHSTPTQAVRETLLLRLAEAASTGQSFINLAQRFRAQNQWALDGKEINLDFARSAQYRSGNGE